MKNTPTFLPPFSHSLCADKDEFFSISQFILHSARVFKICSRHKQLDGWTFSSFTLGIRPPVS